MTGLLAAGLAHHQAGRLAEAEQCYRRILTTRPDHADALHLLGLIALHAKRFEAAIDLISQAIDRDPTNFAYNYNLGVVLHEAGRPEESAALYEETVRLDPLHVEGYANLAVVLTELKRPEEAIVACDRAIALNPGHAAAHYNRGNAYRDLRRFDDAVRDYDAAIRLNPHFADAHANRGISLGDLERWDEAIASHDRAIALLPGNAEFHYNKGITQRANGQYQAAIESYDRCLRLNPAHAEALANRANAMVEDGQVDAALVLLNNAISQRPGDANLLYNRAVTLEHMRRWEAAIQDYRHALSMVKAFPECEHNLGLSLLLLGRFEEAWPLTEARFDVGQFAARRLALTQPRWTGEPLNGRTLLIYAEQGFGDSIQFIRYAAEIGGGRIVLAVPRALRRLMTGVPGVDQVVVEGDDLPPLDVHCPMLSLPVVFGTTAGTIPPPAQLNVPDTAPVLPDRDGLKIGIVWSGNPAHSNDRNRSMPLRAMLPLLERAGLVCALQTFVHEADRTLLAQTPEILDLGPGLRDFADTAAAISALDLVISVDTSVAHLAASMGKPTWILLPFRPEWRWQLDRSDSPWYPSARLFRQTTKGDWSGVIDQVREALAGWPFPADRT